MIRAFMDYPTARVMVHADPDCVYFRRPEEPGHRFVQINSLTITEELQNFRRDVYPFAAVAEKNVVWLEVDLGGREFEGIVLEYIRGLLAEHYKTFASAETQIHRP